MIESELLPHIAGYWDGRFQSVEGAATFEVLNPANGERLARVPELGGSHAEAAVAAADAAMAEPPDLPARAAMLRRIAATLTEHREELARIITLENGKPIGESRAEVEYSAAFYEDAAGRIAALAPQTLEARPRGFVWRVHHRPAGVAGLITPWNFPLGMLAKKLSGALAAGCSAVVKPAEKTPLSCLAFFTLLDRLGLPPGQCNLVFGDAPAIGDVFCKDRRVRVVSFTGSTPVGRLLSAQCAPHIKRIALELGGNAPFVVFADADLEHAAEQVLANKFRCAGQTCVCTNRVLVEASAQEAFTAAVATRVGALRVGSGLEPDNDVGPLIDAQSFAKVRGLVDDALSKGARAVVGGRPDASESRFFPPTVLTGITTDMACGREEIFGPVVPISTFEGEEEATIAANDTEYGLAAYIFTADNARAQRVAARLHFGHVGINTATGPTPEAPFGGMRQSGLGREGGMEGILEFIELQTIPEAPA